MKELRLMFLLFALSPFGLYAYSHLSPYAYCAGNPVNYVDPNGMEFTEVAQGYANNLIREALQRMIGAITAQEIDWNVVTQASNTINEVVTLKKSSQLYDVVEDSDLEFGYGTTRTNSNNRTIEIALGSMSAPIDLIAHEFKHLYQFETGAISLTDKNVKGYGHFLYDKTDEVEAYDRGYIFGGPKYSVGNLPSIYDSRPSNNLTILNPKYSNVSVSSDPMRINHVLNKLRDYYRQSFRYNGITYFYIPK